MRYRITNRWSAEANYTFLTGRDLLPVRPTRRLPPQEGGVRLRFTPPGRRPWFEIASRLAGPQNRLNGGDIDDDRIGASRRRSDVATFFRAYVVSQNIAAGADGRLATADDIFKPTGETLRQIQDRVLPLNSVLNGVLISGDGIRAPLYLSTGGWISLDLKSRYPINDRMGIHTGVSNLLDHNYRVHGSGVDAAGVNIFVGLHYKF